MNRRTFIGAAVVLTLIDAVIHLRRSLLPDGNPFGSVLHEQFLVYCVGAVLLSIALVISERWLGERAWLAALAMIIWQVGAVGVWFIGYHAPNPAGLLPDEGYVSKLIEALVILALLPTLPLFVGRRNSLTPSV